jgi:hypothetical protein
MDKWVGMFLLFIVVAFMTIASLAVYSMFGTTPQTADSFGNAFGNKTNQTTLVERTIAPISISIEGYVMWFLALMIACGAILSLGLFIVKGGARGGTR